MGDGRLCVTAPQAVIPGSGGGEPPTVRRPAGAAAAACGEQAGVAFDAPEAELLEAVDAAAPDDDHSGHRKIQPSLVQPQAHHVGLVRSQNCHHGESL